MLASGRDLEGSTRLILKAEPGEATLTGSLFDSPGEGAVQVGADSAGEALTITITLVHDTWSDWDEAAAAAAAAAAAREANGVALPLALPGPTQDAILSGLAGSGASAAVDAGWERAVSPALLTARRTATASGCTLRTFNASAPRGDVRWVVGTPYATGVARPNGTGAEQLHWVNDSLYSLCPTAYRMVALDASTVELVLPPVPAYNISTPESILATVPSSAVSSGRQYAAFPPFVMRPSRGAAELDAASTLLAADEAAVRATSSTLVKRPVLPSPSPSPPPSPPP